MARPIRAEDVEERFVRSHLAKHAAAFFDFDGTLVKGHMIADFPAHLAEAGLFGATEALAVRKCMISFRAGKITYRKVAEELPALYARGVKGRRVKDIEREGERFVEGRMSSVFKYAKPLVALMKRSGRVAIGLSGSPIEPVMALGTRLGLDVSFGTILQKRDGTYAGRVRHNMILMETKTAFFRRISGVLKLEKERCFGFGDTEQDESFLGKVGHPVSLNPSPELRAIALRNGWPIFTLQDDVIGKVRKLLRDSG